jgi:UDP-glucose 4-epimerase
MKILITGGAGFIGSNIQDKYIALGHDVTVLDDLSTGKLAHINPKADFVKGDICDETLVNRLVSEKKFDLINHHAAQINVRYSFSDPIKDCRVNVLGTLSILRAIIDNKVPKIIFASTGGAIYGDPDELPADEETKPQPGSPYAISKLTCENYIRTLGSLYGFNYTILRYANVYGPRQIAKGEAGVVAIYTERLLKGIPPVIFGSGENTRDYVFVDDVVEANVLAMTKGNGGTFNIGCGVETNVKEVYEAVSSAFGDKALKAEWAPEVPEVGRISLDSALARMELGWEPRVDFHEGVKRTVRSFGVDVPETE